MKLENTDNFSTMIIEWKCVMSDIRADILMLWLQKEIEWYESFKHHYFSLLEHSYGKEYINDHIDEINNDANTFIENMDRQFAQE